MSVIRKFKNEWGSLFAVFKLLMYNLGCLDTLCSMHPQQSPLDDINIENMVQTKSMTEKQVSIEVIII